jgi:hypothetical protein
MMLTIKPGDPEGGRLDSGADARINVVHHQT